VHSAGEITVSICAARLALRHLGRASRDPDLYGFLGLVISDVRPGFEQVRVTIEITGDFDRNQLAGLTRFSPVREIVSNPVPVAIDVARA
jgi:hypothetical protein